MRISADTEVYDTKLNSIGDVLQRYQKQLESEGEKLPRSGANSEYAEIIGQFTDALNAEREGTKFPKLAYSRVAYMLQHLDMWDKKLFLHMCQRYKREKGSFGMCFFGALKTK